MSFNVGQVVRRPVEAHNRVEALIALLRAYEEEINAPDTLKIEINCGGDGFTFSAIHAVKIVASVPVRVGVQG